MRKSIFVGCFLFVILPIIFVNQKTNGLTNNIKMTEPIVFSLSKQDSIWLDIQLIIDKALKTNPDWDVFLAALEWQESRGNDSIIGTKDDVGLYQITPIFLAECNNILGYEYYKLSDRFDRVKQREMVTVLNSKWNPSFCKERAIFLHNSRAPKSYRESILNRYRYYKNKG